MQALASGVVLSGSTWAVSVNLDDLKSLPAKYKTIGGIMAVNLAVFALFKSKNPRTLAFMMRHFTCSTESMRSRPWTLLTSCFAQATPAHLFVNMLSAGCLASMVGDEVTPSQLLALYAGAGLAGSGLSLAHKVAVRNGLATLGASGCIMGLLGAVAVVHPSLLVAIPLGSVPFSKAVGVVFGMDCLGILRGWSRLDHAAHAGGFAFGGASAAWIKHKDAIRHMIGSRIPTTKMPEPMLMM